MREHRRPSLRRALAALLTGTLVAAGAIVGVAAPAQAVVPPTLSATATVTPGVGVSVAVAGDGFEIAPLWPGQSSRGAYVAFVEKGNLTFDQTSTPNASLVVSDAGEISGSLTVAVAGLDRTRSYEVISWPTRSFPTAENLLARSDVAIDWAALFPPQATTTTLSVSPSGSSTVGTDLTLTATVAPAAAGTVTFASASGALGAPVGVTDGVARYTVVAPAAGDYSFSASFSSADAGSYASSASAAISHSVTAPAAPVADPKVTVSPSTNLDPAVENVLTVSGTGFVGAGAASGTYVAIGADGVFSGTGAFPSQGWITVEWVRADQIVDGAFTTTLTVPAGSFAAATSYEVVTSAAHRLSISDRSLDSFTPVTVKQPAPVADPKVTVSPSTNLDPAVENVLTVSGTGFVGAGAASGTYVAIGADGVFSGTGAFPSQGWITVEWVRADQIVDGAFTTTLTIPAGTLDPGKTYQVATSAAHRLSITDRTLDTFTPVTVAQAAVDPTITVTGAVVAGGELTVNGVGFTEGDRVLVEVHSDPYALGTATVGANGRFTITGTLPATFPAGAHTVVAIVNGVTLASTAVTVGAAPTVETPAVATCTAQAVAGASITWGVKQSFVSYINGPIANGSASIAWGSGSGSFNTDETRGRVAFGGAASFTGHSGLLDLTISNPTIQVTGSSATLSAYVSSAAYGGNPAVNGRVVLANLSLPTPSTSGGAISWSGASATLTAAGAQAFGGFYTAGTAMDPVSFRFPLGAEVPCDVTTSGELASTGGTTPDGTVWLGLGLLVLGAALVVLRRRRTGTLAA